MLIKLADDKSKRLALLQDLQQSLMTEGGTLYLRERGYALKVVDHNPCQSKSAIL